MTYPLMDQLWTTGYTHTHPTEYKFTHLHNLTPSPTQHPSTSHTHVPQHTHAHSYMTGTPPHKHPLQHTHTSTTPSTSGRQNALPAAPRCTLSYTTARPCLELCAHARRPTPQGAGRWSVKLCCGRNVCALMLWHQCAERMRTDRRHHRGRYPSVGWV